MFVGEGQIVTVIADGERGKYVVTGLGMDAIEDACGRHYNPHLMKLLRLADQGSDREAPGTVGGTA